MRPLPWAGSESGADRVQKNVPGDFAGRLGVAGYVIVIPFLPEIADAESACPYSRAAFEGLHKYG